MASGISLVALVGSVAGGGYLLVNHLASSVHHIPGVTALDAENQPVVPAATRHSMTVLLTGPRYSPAPAAVLARMTRRRRRSWPAG